MNKNLWPVAGYGLAGISLLAGCQTTNSCGTPAPISTTANCPQRPPLRQRLFGSVQKPGNCSTCPPLPPGSIPVGSLPPGQFPQVPKIRLRRLLVKLDTGLLPPGRHCRWFQVRIPLRSLHNPPQLILETLLC